MCIRDSVQTVKGGAEGQQLPGDGPGQRRPAHRGRAARIETAGLFGQFRETARKLVVEITEEEELDPAQLERKRTVAGRCV